MAHSCECAVHLDCGGVPAGQHQASSPTGASLSQRSWMKLYRWSVTLTCSRKARVFQTRLNLASRLGSTWFPNVATADLPALLNLASNVAEPWLPDVVKPGFPTWLIKLVVQKKLSFRPPGRHRCGLNLYNAPFSKEQLRFSFRFERLSQHERTACLTESRSHILLS